MFSFPLKVNLITSCSLNYVIKKMIFLTCVSRIVINDPLVSNSSGYTILLIVRCLVIVASHIQFKSSILYITQKGEY